MSSTALKILALVTLLLAVGLGYVAYRMSQSMTAAQAPAPGVEETRAEYQSPRTMAIVAVQPIRAHEAVEDKHIERVAVSVLPPEYFESKDEVLGKRPLVDIDTGTTVTPRLFKESNLLSKSIPRDHRAMSLEIDDVIAVGGFVQPGDVIDALLYIRSQNREVDDSQARLLLEKATVLAYEERLLPESEADKDITATGNTQQRQRRQRTVVLAVPEDDTVRVMLGASIGDIRLALHGHSDAAEPDAGSEAAVVVDVASADGRKDEAEEPSVKPITLRELSRIKKASGSPRYTPAPIYVYRGNQVQTVRQ